MDEIRRALVLETLSPGDPLPSIRQLASELRVSPNTVAQAYSELEREGLAYVQRGRGTFVAPDVKPGRDERRSLAREVAKRALIDAHRNGLGADELVDAIHDVAGGGEWCRKDDTHGDPAGSCAVAAFSATISAIPPGPVPSSSSGF